MGKTVSSVTWTPEMIDYLREVVPGRTAAEARDLIAQRFGVPVTEIAVKSAKQRFGVRSGIGPRYGREHVRPDCAVAKNWFKPGVNPANGKVVPIGSERVSANGVVLIKVREFASEPNKRDNWVTKARYIWEQAHGKCPDDCMIMHADHDNRNFALDNLVCVRKSDWATITSKHIPYHDAETLRIAVDIARLRSATYRRECERRQRSESTLRSPTRPNSPDRPSVGTDAHGNEISD